MNTLQDSKYRFLEHLQQALNWTFQDVVLSAQINEVPRLILAKEPFMPPPGISDNNQTRKHYTLECFFLSHIMQIQKDPPPQFGDNLLFVADLPLKLKDDSEKECKQLISILNGLSPCGSYILSTTSELLFRYALKISGEESLLVCKEIMERILKFISITGAYLDLMIEKPFDLEPAVEQMIKLLNTQPRRDDPSWLLEKYAHLQKQVTQS